MRILLHDTQAGLERFSERVDSLIGAVEGTKIEIGHVKKMFEVERTGLLEDIRSIGACMRVCSARPRRTFHQTTF